MENNSKFEKFKECLEKADLKGMRDNLEVEFLDKFVDNKNEKTPIHYACEKGWIELVKTLTDLKCNIECDDKNKKRPIHYACENGWIEIVKTLIDLKCNVECDDKNNKKPIHYACSAGSFEIVKALIDLKCNFECDDKNKKKPIHYACWAGSVEIVKTLIDLKCNAECDDKNKKRPIHYACEKGCLGIVKTLLDLKCNFECDDKNNKKPIHYACWAGSFEIVKTLIDLKCNFECEDEDKKRPIHYACLAGSFEIVKALIDLKCNIECDDKNKKKPIHYACWAGSVEIVKYFIDLKCNVECDEEDKKRPIHYACWAGNYETAKSLIDIKCNIECEDGNKKRPIHYACWAGSVEIVKTLIDLKCNFECDDKNKRRPIHYACEKGNREILKTLIDLKCNFEFEDEDKKRPIHYACEKGCLEIVKTLLDLKCNIECDDKNNKKPIHYACWAGSFEIVKTLIDLKCNVECEDEDKMRPIHYACEKGNLEIVKTLIDRKCNVECEDYYKKRPIHYACEKGSLEIVEILIDLKCEIEVYDCDGRTPLELAKSGLHYDIVKFIEEIKLTKEIGDSIRNNDDETFAKVYSIETLMTIESNSGQSLLAIALETKGDKIIKYILDQPMDSEDIRYIKKLMENDSSKLVGAQMWQEVFLFKCIRDHHQEGFQLISCARLMNCDRKIVPSSFLEVASEYGSFAFVEDILKKSIFEKETWERAKKIALRKGYNKIENLISNRELLLECKRKGNLSILHIAVCDNEPDMVKYILEKKDLVDPNYNNEIVGTALALAIVLCNEKCMKVFEKFSIDCNTKNKYLQSPLHEAICNGMIDQCKYLIDRAENINEKGFMGQTALHCAVIMRCEELCAELIKKGADCNGYMEFLQSSPQKKGTQISKNSLSLSKWENCMTLCSKLNKTIYPCLLEALNENTINSSDDEGNSLLHLTIEQLDRGLCETLIKLGGDVNSVNKPGKTPLFEFLSNLDKEKFKKNEDKIIDIVNLFIKSKYSVNKWFSTNLTIFDIALQFNCERLLLALVPPSQQNQILVIDEDFFRIAFEKEYFQFCQAVLELIPQGYFEGGINQEFINIAIFRKKANLLKHLVLHATKDIKQSAVEQVLYHLAKFDDQECFDSLLDIEIMAPKYLKNGETVLTELLNEEKIIYCEKLIQSGINNKKYINMKNRKNQTPLQIAIEKESMVILHDLILETDDLDNEDLEGRTALMQFFEKIPNKRDRNRYFTFIKLIKTIIFAGGNIYYENSKGKKNIEYCSNPETRKDIEDLVKTKQKR